MNKDNIMIGLATKRLKYHKKTDIVNLNEVMQYIEENYNELEQTFNEVEREHKDLIVTHIKDKIKEISSLLEVL